MRAKLIRVRIEPAERAEKDLPLHAGHRPLLDNLPLLRQLVAQLRGRELRGDGRRRRVDRAVHQLRHDEGSTSRELQPWRQGLGKNGD